MYIALSSIRIYYFTFQNNIPIALSVRVILFYQISFKVNSFTSVIQIQIRFHIDDNQTCMKYLNSVCRYDIQHRARIFFTQFAVDRELKLVEMGVSMNRGHRSHAIESMNFSAF